MKFTKLRKLLRDYLAKDATSAEQKVVDVWYESFSNKEERVPMLDDQAEKEALRQKIWQNLPIHIQHPSWYRRNRVFLWSFNTAALLAVVFSLGYYRQIRVTETAADSNNAQADAYTTVTASQERKLLTLPDSSRVWLNANSSLTVNAGYGDSLRTVQLEGEAFFDIMPQPERPFIVISPHIKVQVLGTAFNVSAYPGLAEVHVAVDHGKVAVWDRQGNELRRITKGQSLSYATQSQKVKVGYGSLIGSWREGRVLLERASFSQLAQALYNVYGVHLRSDRKDAKGYSYNLQIYAAYPLEKMMDVISSMHRLKYRRDKDEIVLY